MVTLSLHSFETQHKSTTCKQHYKYKYYTSSEILVSVLLLYRHSKKEELVVLTLQLNTPHWAFTQWYIGAQLSKSDIWPAGAIAHVFNDQATGKVYAP